MSPTHGLEVHCRQQRPETQKILGFDQSCIEACIQTEPQRNDNEWGWWWTPFYVHPYNNRAWKWNGGWWCKEPPIRIKYLNVMMNCTSLGIVGIDCLNNHDDSCRCRSIMAQQYGEECNLSLKDKIFRCNYYMI